MEEQNQGEDNQATDDQDHVTNQTANSVEAWPLLSERKGEVNLLEYMVPDHSQSASLFAGTVLGLDSMIVGDDPDFLGGVGLDDTSSTRSILGLDLTLDFSLPRAGVSPADEAATAGLPREVVDTRLLDTNGNLPLTMDLGFTLPHSCASWCTGDLAVLDNIDIPDMNAASARFPDQLALDLNDSPLLVESDWDSILSGHDSDDFGV